MKDDLDKMFEGQGLEAKTVGLRRSFEESNKITNAFLVE